MTTKSEKTFGLSSLKKLSNHMSLLKSLSCSSSLSSKQLRISTLSISSTGSTPESLSDNIHDFDCKASSSSHLLQSKLDLSLNSVNSVSKSLHSLKSGLQSQGSKVSKLVKLSRNRARLGFDDLAYDTKNLQKVVFDCIEDKSTEIRQEINYLEKERKLADGQAKQNFNEKFQSMKYVVDKESNARTCQSEILIDQVDREVKAFEQDLKKAGNERRKKIDWLWNVFESNKNDLENEIQQENAARVKVQNKIIELFEETCNKIKKK